jgi:Na+-transporting NADH:ubiquinone oxidoreductase subunit NqrF
VPVTPLRTWAIEVAQGDLGVSVTTTFKVRIIKQEEISMREGGLLQMAMKDFRATEVDRDLTTTATTRTRDNLMIERECRGKRWN